MTMVDYVTYHVTHHMIHHVIHHVTVSSPPQAQPQCANLSVANYMLETVQRIPRYKLLLQGGGTHANLYVPAHLHIQYFMCADYIKHLPEDSDDRDKSQSKTL